VLFKVRISNSPLFPLNSCFNIVHNVNVLQFNHKHISNRQKNSVHVIGLHDVTATMDKTPFCKIWKSADAKKLFYVHPRNVVLNFTNFKKYLKIHEFYWILNVKYVRSGVMWQRICLSVREHISGNTCLQFCLCLPWLGRPLAALRSVKYFRVCRWRHTCTYGAYRSIPLQRVTSLRRRAQAVASLLCRIGCVVS